MKSIKDAQSSLVNDTCAECGSYVDIGAVIEESDTLLKVEFVGESAIEQAEQLGQQAKARFADVTYQVQAMVDGAQLLVNFGCSAEKMIFQLQHSLP
ncbi:hypothetical protein HR45_11860 [Shewanella mangrovi]|uniref:DUF406 family protein n=2 Tax=Shewanella mangrovi TaxID=1515746 RepID=A0A094JY76_9GAMM|nr:DUF406 family protein [Shewanella mangrovi]KFZ37341.1 hypothetical protein HR45_11860 [Shewanella mangrovi]